MADLPVVVVLLATYNGAAWLPEQLDTILDQQDVRVVLVVSDDGSTDCTAELLAERAAADPRITVLPTGTQRLGSAGNFYRLLRDLPTVPGLSGTEPVAFADQDDRWHPGKLAAQLPALADGVDGVSSNVLLLQADGSTSLLRKDFPQRDYDYLFESPGPGCTFLLSPRLAALVAGQLVDPDGPATGAAFHDWLVYALCRAAGWRWRIQSGPTVDYRQHEANTFGANVGLSSRLSRLGLVGRGWHRRQAALIADACLPVAAPELRPGLQTMRTLTEGRGPVARLRLAAHCRQLRRRPRDRVLLGVMIGVGWW